MSKILEVLQGIPGSGKTSYAQNTLLGSAVCSADDYFVTYRFDHTHLGKAHTECMRAFLSYMYSGKPHVVVDNTNTTLEEMVPYVRVAQAMGYTVHVHTFVCSPEVSAQRNTHGVPLKACERMYKRMTTPPKRWGIGHIVHHTD